jgi:hypothetical protein
MRKDQLDYKIEILVKEWDAIQGAIGRFDTLAFNIKGWAISLFTAVLVVSATQRVPELMILAILPLMMFWLIDALYKSFQRRYIIRGTEIETYLSSESFVKDIELRSIAHFSSPVINIQFGSYTYLHRIGLILRSAFSWNVFLLYFSMLALCLAAYSFLVSK